MHEPTFKKKEIKKAKINYAGRVNTNEPRAAAQLITPNVIKSKSRWGPQKPTPPLQTDAGMPGDIPVW